MPKDELQEAMNKRILSDYARGITGPERLERMRAEQKAAPPPVPVEDAYAAHVAQVEAEMGERDSLIPGDLADRLAQRGLTDAEIETAAGEIAEEITGEVDSLVGELNKLMATGRVAVDPVLKARRNAIQQRLSEISPAVEITTEVVP